MNCPSIVICLQISNAGGHFEDTHRGKGGLWSAQRSPGVATVTWDRRPTRNRAEALGAEAHWGVGHAPLRAALGKWQRDHITHMPGGAWSLAKRQNSAWNSLKQHPQDLIQFFFRGEIRSNQALGGWAHRSGEVLTGIFELGAGR